MSSISASEAEIHFGELLHRVENGEEIVIMRDDRPVARVIREDAPSQMQVRESVAGLRRLNDRIRTRTGGIGLSDLEIRAAIEEGRM